VRPQRLRDLDARERWREIARVATSLVLVSAAVLAVYFRAPLSAHGAVSIAGFLVLAALLFAASFNRQMRRITGARVPELRAIQAVVVSVLLFLVLFATTYLLLTAGRPDSFSEPLDRTRALYFAVTVFSTVGFGDITPKTGAASIVVSIQMLLDLVVIGVVVRTFVGAARTGLARADTPDESGSS
jgi:voltage-gated potassium channel